MKNNQSEFDTWRFQDQPEGEDSRVIRIEKNDDPEVWPFYFELVGVVLVVIILIWCTIPTNVINSHPTLLLLEDIGILGAIAITFGGIPVGILGLVKARKRMVRFKVITIVLSICNILAALAVIGVIVIIGASVALGYI